MRILLVTPCPPLPLSVGGNQRTFLLERALRHIGAVDLFLVKNEKEVRETAGPKLWTDFRIVGISELVPAARRSWFWRMLRPLRPALIDRLAHNWDGNASRFHADPVVAGKVQQLLEANHYDFIVCRYLKTLGQIGPTGKTPVVVDVDDLDSGIYLSRLAMPAVSWWQRLVLRWHLRNIEAALPSIIERCAWLWVSNPNDIRALPPDRCSVLPNRPLSFPPLSGKASPHPKTNSFRMMVVGSWGHTPNRHGVEHFVTNIFPEVRRLLPDAILMVVGSQMDDAWRERLTGVPGVEAVGFVDDLAAEYARCDCVVAPIFYGGGTNIKVLEALAHGKAAVISAAAFRGYEGILVSGEDLLIAADDAGWTRQLGALAGNPEWCARMGRKARQSVEIQFGEEKFNATVAATFSHLASPRFLAVDTNDLEVKNS